MSRFNSISSRVISTVLGLLLAGCGGGGGGGSASVSTITASNARFGNTSVITVNGANLRSDGGVRVGIEGPCEGIVSTGVGTDDTQQYTCEVRGIGEFIATVYDSGQRAIGRVSAKVPAPEVTVVTSAGTFTLELDATAAPESSRGFLGYVNAGFYRNMIIHRAVKDVLVQTGAFNTALAAKAATRPAIPSESLNGLKNLRGTVALTRGVDALAPSAQWLVNLRDNPGFDRVDSANPGLAVFGRVIQGLSVLETIAAAPTKIDVTSNLEDVPVTEVLITSATQTR